MENDECLIAFYRGEGHDHKGRRRLEDIWALPYFWLEHTHDYIQWLFPIPEMGRFKAFASLLTPWVVLVPIMLAKSILPRDGRGYFQFGELVGDDLNQAWIRPKQSRRRPTQVTDAILEQLRIQPFSQVKKHRPKLITSRG
ncbi:opioid growth factor receptor-related protein [Vreelandella titanicae]|uniref:opioid growth factor receptor-related protein n=1 Tax=Vreelandella titanicae TaxID=664683 RepID=UPI001CC2593B|nr:opioid growth factor receptor-related protein [Halomonas titanicae]